MKKTKNKEYEELLHILYMYYIRITYSMKNEYTLMKILLENGEEKQAIAVIEKRLSAWKRQWIEYSNLPKDVKEYNSEEVKKIMTLLQNKKTNGKT